MESTWGLNGKLPERKKGSWRIKDTFLFILVGVVLILFTIIIKKDAIEINLGHVGLELLSHVGIGFIVIGMLGILIDSKHWTDYFEQRLFNISTEKKYLEKLEADALSNLQTEVLKVYYKNNDLGGADGFLNFYQKNVQAFVSSPFRINANLNLQIDYDSDDNTKFQVHETMSWTCKSNGGKIQPNVVWLPGEDEFEKINDFEVILEHKKFANADNPNGARRFPKEVLKKQNCISENGMGFHLPLNENSSVDGLYVVVKVNYLIARERFFASRMALPTRGMIITVQFPKDLKIVTEFYFDENNPVHFEKKSNTGYYHLNVEGWIMPDQGFALQLLNIRNDKNEHKEMKAESSNTSISHLSA